MQLHGRRDFGVRSGIGVGFWHPKPTKWLHSGVGCKCAIAASGVRCVREHDVTYEGAARIASW